MKQILVIRKDLKMRRGKEIAQGAHASLLATLNYREHKYVQEWLQGTFTKITVTVDSEAELLALADKAIYAGIPYGLIKDAGKTEFHGVETYTTVAIGPAPNEILEPITGNLRLY